MILRRLPSLPTWSTGFRELEEARRDMERLFDSLAGYSGLRSSGVFPAINVSEDTESLYVRAELPGIKIDDLDITMENETLTIAGEREQVVEEAASAELPEQTAKPLEAGPDPIPIGGIPRIFIEVE